MFYRTSTINSLSFNCSSVELKYMVRAWQWSFGYACEFGEHDFMLWSSHRFTCFLLFAIKWYIQLCNFKVPLRRRPRLVISKTQKSKLENIFKHHVRFTRPGGSRLLPYRSFLDMCHCEGNGFLAVQPWIRGRTQTVLFWNRV